MNACCNSPSEDNEDNNNDNNKDILVEIEYYSLKKVIPLALSSVIIIHFLLNIN